MAIVTSTEMQTAHAAFCKHMRLDTDRWDAIFEFAHFLDFSIINVCRSDIRKGTEFILTDRINHAVDLLLGPNAQVVVLAYKHRRYSFLGRIRAAIAIPTLILMFICVIIAALVTEIVGK